MSPQIKDHNGNDVTHGPEKVNGVRPHYAVIAPDVRGFGDSFRLGALARELLGFED